MSDSEKRGHSEEWTNPVEAEATTSASRTIPSWLDWAGALGIAIYGTIEVVSGADLLRQYVDGGIEGSVSYGFHSASSAPYPRVTVLLLFFFGLIYMLAGYWYLNQRRRARRGGQTPAWLAGREHIVSSAGFGILTIWTVISPIIAGGIAGYLESDSNRASRAGALSGALCILLILVPFFITSIPWAAGEVASLGTSDPGAVAVVFLLFGAVVTVVITAVMAVLAGVAGRVAN